MAVRPDDPAEDPERLRVLAANVVGLAHVRRLEQSLEAEGVEVLRLKGSGYLGTLYPTLDRRMVDVDLLVRPSGREAARRILERNGYAIVPAPRHWRYSWNRHYNWQFKGGPVHPMIELHQALCADGLFSIDTAGLMDRRVRRHDGVSEMFTLCPEDALLHLAVHLVKDGYVHDERLAQDATRIIEQWAPDWQVVVARARSWRVAAGLAYLLEVTRRAGGAVPLEVAGELVSPARARMVRVIADNIEPIQQRVMRLTKLGVLALEPQGARHLARFAARYAVRRAIDRVYAIPGPEPESEL